MHSYQGAPEDERYYWDDKPLEEEDEDMRPNHDPLEYIRRTYGVPAFKNRVVKTPKGLGVITGASGPHVAVRLSEGKHSFPWHPSDIDYLENSVS